MDEFDTTPEALASLSNDELIALAVTIDERSTELASGELSNETADEIEALAEAYELVNAELVKREEDNAGLAARAAAARARITGGEASIEDGAEASTDDGDDDDGEGDGDADGDADAGAEGEGDAGEAAVEGDAAAAEGEGDAAPVVEATAEASTAVVPSAPRKRAAALIKELNTRQKAKAPATVPSEPDNANPLDGVMLSATRLAPAEFKPGTTMSLGDIAAAITSKRLRMGTVPAGIHDERIAVASAEMPWDRTGLLLGGNEESNYIKLREVQDQIPTLVASGGPCTPFPPRYEIFRLAKPHDPVATMLPTLGAPRGGIKWIVPPDFREARAGVGTVTCAEDAAGYGSGSGEATFKPCVHFDCPDTDEACVTAVSHCIEFGNLQFQVFPEWVEARIADLVVEFTSVKEVLYLDVIDGASIQATTDPDDGYGLARRIFSDVVRAAFNYRKRNGMDVTAPLDWAVPDWLIAAAAVDLINDHSLGLDVLLGRANASGFIGNLLREANIRLHPYYDSATGEDQAFSTVQSDGDLNDWPEDAVTYLFAPGTFIRLDGGELNVGLIRDSVLNRTNDLQIFAEEFTQVAMLGIESIKITHQGVCPNGAAPEPDGLILCGASG